MTEADLHVDEISLRDVHPYQLWADMNSLLDDRVGLLLCPPEHAAEELTGRLGIQRKHSAPEAGQVDVEIPSREGAYGAFRLTP